MNTDLNGRVVLISGASTGIGAATARAYGREGAQVAITYRNNPDSAEEVAADVEASGGQGCSVYWRRSGPSSATAWRLTTGRCPRWSSTSSRLCRAFCVHANKVVPDGV
ncbi:SDR family NAD(P)-dependent oxidoreductase [Sphaerisporangium viridialbum]|uniref:SDR family NAD(P)-dependent oxidoreductase n=1 Tax=Sphaerisporangium viridialbum TaxID=46189 RepID=UPI003C72A3E9